MTKLSTVAAKAELERHLSPKDPRRAALSALPDEMDAAAFDGAFELLLKILHQRPADPGPP